MAKKKRIGRPPKGDKAGECDIITLRIYKKNSKLKKNLDNFAQINNSSLNEIIVDILYNFINKINFNILEKLREENESLNQKIIQLNNLINKKDKEMNSLKKQHEQRKQRILEIKKRRESIKDTPKKHINILIPGSLLKELNHFLVDQYGNVFGHISESFEKGIKLLLNSKL